MRRPQYSRQLRLLMERAQTCAAELTAGYTGTEHLLLALLQEAELPASRILTACGAREQAVRCAIQRGRSFTGVRGGWSREAKELLSHARREAGRLRAGSTEPEHLLLALARTEGCAASKLLAQAGVDADLVFSGAYERLQTQKEQTRRQVPMKLLDQFCEDMVERAAQTPPVVGRERELRQLMQVLARKGKNNPALIGEPGVGKTAVVEAFAKRLASGDVPQILRGRRLLSLSLADVLAGTKYRGEFEERVRDILREIRGCGDVILFIDEMHTIAGAGGAEGAIDCGNLLKPALSRGELQLIGATTVEEYRKHIEKDPALERRFRPLMICEPDMQTAAQMLRAQRPALEKHHGLRITDQAVDAAVELSVRYVADRFLPDKALELLDETAARVWLSGPAEAAARHAREEQTLRLALERAVLRHETERAEALRSTLGMLGSRRTETVTGADVADAVSERTGIPAGTVCSSERERLLGLQQTLAQHVIGQPEAVQAVSTAILRGRTGLADGRRPAASLLLTGPTGVGKTELCKQLALHVFGSAEALVRVDMTEYMDRVSATRLIGAPPGYVGYEQGGTLTEKVRRRPYCVVLFDELEKAHRDVTGLLLQILDDGILTDSLGRTVSFRHTIVIMTSNLTGEQNGRQGLGFTPADETERAQRALREAFSPEFLGRIDCITTFRPLTEQVLAAIAGLQLGEVCARCRSQGLTLEIGAGVAEHLAARCVRQPGGARSLRHEIQRRVEGPAAELCLRHPSAQRLCARMEHGVLCVSMAGAEPGAVPADLLKQTFKNADLQAF